MNDKNWWGKAAKSDNYFYTEFDQKYFSKIILF